jgi:TRAP-type C4-dicarboxylate transport system permease large subunit
VTTARCRHHPVAGLIYTAQGVIILAMDRFKQTFPPVYIACLPYVAILFITVLLITYVPIITLGLLEWWD